MIRKFNYTGRTKIERENARVFLMTTEEDELYFQTTLQLEGYKLNPHATIYVEAYHKGYVRRTPYGTVAHLQEPPREQRLLTDCPTPEQLQFRAKVVDETGEGHGRIVAGADRLEQRNPEQTEANRISLLHVMLDDEMEDRLWDLDFKGEWPELHINSSVEGFKAIVRTDAQFNSLVYPTIVEQVLNEALLDGDEDCGEDESWQTLWIRYARTLPGSTPVPDSREERVQWIRDAVGGFCRHRRCLHNYRQELEKRE